MRPFRALSRSVLIAVMVGGVCLSGVAVAKKGHPSSAGGHGHAAVTKIRFHLDQHHAPQWGDLTADVTFLTHDKNHWLPFAGAEFVLRVGKQDVGTGITDGDGHAALDYVPTDLGTHVLRVVFLGDDAHKRAQRAQGFHVDPAPVGD